MNTKTQAREEAKRQKLNVKAAAWIARRVIKRNDPRNTTPTSPKRPRGQRKLRPSANFFA